MGRSFDSTDMDLLCRRKHGVSLAARETRRLETMHLLSSDFALEQPRPLPPKVKMVGPIMAAPAKPLPAHLQVNLILLALHSTHSHQSNHCGIVKGAFLLTGIGMAGPSWCTLLVGITQNTKSSECLSMQDFVEGAGDRGVVLISLGTIAQFSESTSPNEY